MPVLEAAVVSGDSLFGCIYHSDFGSQCASHEYRNERAKHGLISSMGRFGNSYDDAKAQTFMKTLKCEEMYLSEYEMFENIVE